MTQDEMWMARYNEVKELLNVSTGIRRNTLILNEDLSWSEYAWMLLIDAGRA